jgi:hypothetical protein
MKNKIIGILVCTLLLSMTFSMTTAQKITKESVKNEYQIINILGNSPPTDPIITCPDEVRKNGIFLVTAVSTDPDDDQIYYRIKVGDSGNPSQWLGPYDSGVAYMTGMGIFQYTGDISINYQAKDEWDAESGWSTHIITFTKAKSKPNTLTLISILQNYLQMFPILRNLLLSQ